MTRSTSTNFNNILYSVALIFIFKKYLALELKKVGHRGNSIWNYETKLHKKFDKMLFIDYTETELKNGVNIPLLAITSQWIFRRSSARFQYSIKLWKNCRFFCCQTAIFAGKS